MGIRGMGVRDLLLIDQTKLCYDAWAKGDPSAIPYEDLNPLEQARFERAANAVAEYQNQLEIASEISS